MANESLFFPHLRRRCEYSKTRSGGYYADYSTYRQEIREDCMGRCVYCDTHENETGGAESMELDHFRPKKYPEFADLINDPHNLVWACRGCNHFKGPHWPALGSDGTVNGDEGFIDPFAENRLDYFQVSPGGKIDSIRPPGNYIIKLLALNRFSRKRLRELRIIKESWITEFQKEIKKLQHLVKTEKKLSSEGKEAISKHILWLNEKVKELSVVFCDFSLQ
jgi:5-methylcytosine-specific restriction endonuclease McrA